MDILMRSLMFVDLQWFYTVEEEPPPEEPLPPEEEEDPATCVSTLVTFCCIVVLYLLAVHLSRSVDKKSRMTVDNTEDMALTDERLRILDNKHFLLREAISPDSTENIIPLLYASAVFTNKEYNDLKKRTSQADKTNQLLALFKDKTNKDYDQLISVLESEGQQKAADILMGRDLGRRNSGIPSEKRRGSLDSNTSSHDSPDGRLLHVGFAGTPAGLMNASPRLRRHGDYRSPSLDRRAAPKPRSPLGARKYSAPETTDAKPASPIPERRVHKDTYPPAGLKNSPLVGRRNSPKGPSEPKVASPLMARRDFGYERSREKTGYQPEDDPRHVMIDRMGDRQTILRKQSHGQFIPKSKLEIISKLGEGGYGKVYKAEHVEWGIVVLKELHIQKMKEEQLRLDREAELMVGLSHKNIVQLYGCSVTKDSYGLVMEYMDAGSLQDFLRKCRRRDLRLAEVLLIYFTKSVLEGMCYLHTREPKVLHRDLKSANVLLNQSLDVKLTDFGMSELRTPDGNHTTFGQCGTRTHIPPESLENPFLPANSKFDVYSFGIVIWEILMRGADPYHGKNEMEIAYEVSKFRKRPPLSDLPSNTPPVLRELMVRSWQHFPQQRPEFIEMKREVDQYIRAMMNYEDKMKKSRREILNNIWEGDQHTVTESQQEDDSGSHHTFGSDDENMHTQINVNANANANANANGIKRYPAYQRDPTPPGQPMRRAASLERLANRHDSNKWRQRLHKLKGFAEPSDISVTQNEDLIVCEKHHVTCVPRASIGAQGTAQPAKWFTAGKDSKASRLMAPLSATTKQESIAVMAFKEQVWVAYAREKQITFLRDRDGKIAGYVDCPKEPLAITQGPNEQIYVIAGRDRDTSLYVYKDKRIIQERTLPATPSGKRWTDSAAYHAGFLAIGDRENNNIEIFNTEGHLQRVHTLGEDQGLDSPRGVTWNPRESTLWVSERDGSVHVFTARSWVKKDKLRIDGAEYLRAVAFTQSELLVVVDSGRLSQDEAGIVYIYT